MPSRLRHSDPFVRCVSSKAYDYRYSYDAVRNDKGNNTAARTTTHATLVTTRSDIVTMARTSQADARAHTGARAPPVRHVGVWVQYKGTRARTLQTTKTRDAQAGLTSNITNEFLADLEALKLTLPGLPMVDIRIVWGTGQVRAGYGLKKEVSPCWVLQCETQGRRRVLNHMLTFICTQGLRFDVVIKYLVKRASTEFLERMSELSM